MASFLGNIILMVFMHSHMLKIYSLFGTALSTVQKLGPTSGSSKEYHEQYKRIVNVMLVTKQYQTYENDKKATADRPALYTNQIIQSSKKTKWMGMQW